MQPRHGEHAVNTLQIFDVANHRLLIDVEDRHQIRAEVRDVQAASAAVETLVIESSRSASQWNIGQDTKRQTACGRISLRLRCYWLVRLSVRGWLSVRRGTGNQ